MLAEHLCNRPHLFLSYFFSCPFVALTEFIASASLCAHVFIIRHAFLTCSILKTDLFPYFGVYTPPPILPTPLFTPQACFRIYKSFITFVE